VEEEKEGGEKPPAGEPFVAKTGAARGRSRTRRDRLLPLLPLPPRRAYLLFFLAGQPLRRPSPTRSTSASGHRGEDAASSLLWMPRPSSRGGTPAAPRRHAAAGNAGHRARLGHDFLQVPPPSPTRARRPPSLPPLAVGRRPVSVATAPCRRARVAFTTRESSRARPCEPRRPRPGVHPSTRAPQPWRQGRAFGPFSCLRRRSPQCLGRPCRRDPAVAMWVVHMVAKRRGRHVLGHPEHTAVHPRRVRANQPRAPRSPPPMASSRAPP
jgi:hypothetical protein